MADDSTDSATVPKAAELVARSLRSEIVRGEAEVGTQLPPEAQLIERFGVSRPTLRAALHILEVEELVEVRRGSRGGVWVRSPSVEVMAQRAGAYLQHNRVTLDDVHRARGLVEPPAVEILATRRDPAELAELERALLDEASVLDDPEAVRLAGERFHQLIVELAGNQTLVAFSTMLSGIVDAQTARHQAERVVRGEGSNAPKLHAEHARVLDLIRDGNVEEAQALWRDHLERVRTLVAESEETVLDLYS